MSYAIETKKRKFDKILESLIEGPIQQAQQPESRTSVELHHSLTPAGIVSSRVSSLNSIKKRRVTAIVSKPVSNESLIGHYLPSSRAAFLERLETFRHITKWHIPSTIPINAAEWAKKGWICADVDTVSCGSCLERVAIDLSINSKHDKENSQAETEEDEAELTVQVYEALVRRYRAMITTSHADGCPWRKRSCDTAIQRVEGLLNTSGVIVAIQTRFDTIVDKIDEIPPISELPQYQFLPAPTTDHLRELEFVPTNINAVKLAMCGWQYKEADVVECRNCFRSLGLWLYRGDTPTVENLDAVESHLEYCPWRSPETQDTEITIHPETSKSTPVKLRLPGWALTFHAVQKHTLKKGRGDHAVTVGFQVKNSDGDRESVTPEQRERKMRDLMQRIKEIRKPFNVKGLLRKKDRSEM